MGAKIKSLGQAAKCIQRISIKNDTGAWETFYKVRKRVNGTVYCKSFKTFDGACVFLDMIPKKPPTKKHVRRISSKPSKAGFTFVRMAEKNVELVKYSYNGKDEYRFHVKKMVNRVMHNKHFHTIEECYTYMKSLPDKEKGAPRGRPKFVMPEINEEDEFMYIKSGLKFFLSSSTNKEGLCCINIDGHIQQVSWANLLTMVRAGKIIKISK